MAGGAGNGEREAVLEAVRAFFDEEFDERMELLAGPVREWAEYPHPTRWRDRYDHRKNVDSVEVVELRDTHAVVEVRASQVGTVRRGTREYEVRYDGPIVLEKLDGRWRIVDFTFQGRRRLEALVFGPLAEQQQEGVTVRVLAVDRQTGATQYAVELVNETGQELWFDQAYALFETQTSWARLHHDPGITIAPGSTRVVVLQSAGNFVALDDPVLGLALRVRAGKRKLRFLLKVPLAKPEHLEPQRPPRMLPLLRSSWPRRLAYIAVITAATAWWVGWYAILLPLLVALSAYMRIRVHGVLPERLDPVRFVLDALVAVAAFLLLWETAPFMAVPAAVGALVYLILWAAARRRKQLRVIGALTVATGWALLLGTSSGALSPCRLADGRPASAADAFARALLTGDRERVRTSSSYRPADEGFAPWPRPVSAAVAERVVATRTNATGDEGFCGFYAHAAGCYEYLRSKAAEFPWLVVVLDCGGRSWDVDLWYISG